MATLHDLIIRNAESFAMEFMTGHYRELRDDERQRYEQLKVVMLAFASQVQRLSKEPAREGLCCCAAHHQNLGRCLQCPEHGVKAPPVSGAAARRQESLT